MFVILTDAEFASLPEVARTAILDQLGGSPKPEEVHTRRSNLADMTYEDVVRFMNGVAGKTRACMRVFARNDGTAEPREFLEVTGHSEEGDLRGVHAGITKRTRGILHEPKVYLVHWRSGPKGGWDGHWYMSPASTEAFKRYFDIESPQ